MRRRTNHILSMLLAAVGSVGLGACGGEGEGNDPVSRLDAVVYEGAGSVQCGPPGITPEQSAQKLINAGIDVMRSGCGGVTGVAGPAVCGASDGKIRLHEVRAVNVSDAEQLGFHSVSELRNSEGKGYVWLDCQTGAILP